MTRRLGIHLSIAGGVTNAVGTALELGVNTLQVFLKSPSQWMGPPIDAREARRFRGMIKDAGITAFAHAGYMINLASSTGNGRRRSIDAMLDELERASLLGIDSLVVHPGSHGGAGTDTGIRRAAESLDIILKRSRHRRIVILLETTAGQGNSLGARFEELRAIIDASRHGARLGICLDTCHVFAAGYDISRKKSTMAVIDKFDNAIGLERLSLIHLNDSKKEAGSRIDRHEHIGAGRIGKTGMRALLNDPRLVLVPAVLETPKENGLEADIRNLAAVRALMKPISKRRKSIQHTHPG